MPPLIRSASTLSNAAIKSVSDIDLRVPKAIDLDEIDKINEEENEDDNNCNITLNNQENNNDECTLIKKSPSDNEIAKSLQSTADCDDHNRTMVLQVGRNDLRLISPDRKIILLHKQHRDVSTCVQV